LAAQSSESAALELDATTQPRSRWRLISGDIAGGFAAALIAIPQAMSLGVLAFAALGPAYASTGVIAGLFTSVIANLVATAIPASRCQIVGARASTTVVFAGILAALVAHPLLQTPQGPDYHQAVTLAFMGLFFSGVLQIALGLSGLGRAIKYVPYPVIAGFMNGIALTILVAQIGPVLGLEAGHPLFADLTWSAVKPASLVVAAAVVAAIFLAPRVTRKLPAILIGLLVGVPLHYLFDLVSPGLAGPVVGALPDIELSPHELTAMFDFQWRGEPLAWVLYLLPAALLLAAVGALDGLLASVVVDSLTHSRHDSKRLLTGQGAGNALCAAFGAIPAVANAHTRAANYLAGGRTRLSTLYHALFMLAAMVALGPLVAGLPVAALSGLMIYIGVTLIDRWTRDLLRRLRSDDRHRHEIVLNLGIVAGVALVLLFSNMMAAFAAGVIAAVALLLFKLSGSPVRRMLDGTVRTSLKVRGAAARAVLRPLAKNIRIIELQGEIFFGTADRLQTEIESLPEGTRFLILDFRRVNQIDASGARVLEVIAQLVTRRHIRLLLSHMREDEPRGQYLKALGVAAAVDPSYWFPDLDRALEWAEDRALERARFEDAPELSLREMAMFDGLDEAEMEVLSKALERHELHHGDTVFLEGDEGDRMYLIARGAVSIKVKLEEEMRARRLATFNPGVFFGEMSMIEGRRRSADAFAKGANVVLYSLSAAKFAELVRQHPQVGLKLYQNLSRELAARLRSTSGALRALE
jgi:SulP family sulfate permease